MSEPDQRNTKLINARIRKMSPTGSGHPMSRQELAEAVNTWQWRSHQREDRLDETDIGRLERGETHWPGPARREGLRAVLGVATDTDLGFYRHRRTQAPQDATISPDRTTPRSAHALMAPTVTDQDHREHIELLRLELTDALSEGTMAEASLDDWEQTVLRYGRATRDRPPELLLHDLSTDLTDLRRTLRRHRSASALRQLTRVAAHMSGMMCLTFCKLDDRPAFRLWARTARLAADEAGDPQTRSWVLAQEAYGHYYSGDLFEAVDVAQHAQAVVVATPCVGAALAAALEARACAAAGRNQETQNALGRAEEVLSHLDGASLTPSAFGYTEAQLRFHEGSAYTHLRNARAAIRAQDRALELCAPGDFTDWAMTRLDRALCLCQAERDTGAGLDYAIQTLTALSESLRRGIITLRGHELLNSLSKSQRASLPARNLHELLMLTSEPKEVREP